MVSACPWPSRGGGRADRGGSPPTGDWRTLSDMRRFVRISPALLCLGLLVMAIASPVFAAPEPESAASPSLLRDISADLPVVSGGRHLWLWAADSTPNDPNRPRVALFHADSTHRGEKGPAWEPVTQLSGRLTRHGAAAGHDRLYLIFEDRQVHYLTLRRGPVPDQWFYQTHVAASLPTDTTLRASAVVGDRLWALVRVDSEAGLDEIDGAVESAAERNQRLADEQQTLNLILGLPLDQAHDEFTPSPTPDAESPPEPSPADGPAQAGIDPDNPPVSDSDESADAPADEPRRLPADRLLVLDRGQWKSVDLPTDWPANLATLMAAPRGDAGPPVLLVTLPSAAGRSTAKLYRAESSDPSSWETLAIELAAGQAILPRRVDDQLLLVTGKPSAGRLVGDVAAVRGESVIDIGEIGLDLPSPQSSEYAWTAMALGESIVLAAGSSELASEVLKVSQSDDAASAVPGPVFRGIDLHGRPSVPPLTVGFAPREAMAEMADYIILLGVVITSTVLLFTFWRRDPAANELTLPAELGLADPLRRAIAGLIDLAPGLLTATVLYGLSLQELYERWPGRGVGMPFSLMMPGLIAVAVVVAHTTVFECISGRSLGKLATGLRVVNLRGQRPKLWQLLARGVLKAFDLVAYLLLILPLISPYRQRLGDMVARTVVVAKRDAEQASDDAQGGDR